MPLPDTLEPLTGRILFELPERETVTFRRKDMDNPEIREKLLLVIRVFLFALPPESARPTLPELEEALALVPDSWEYLAFTVHTRKPEEGGVRHLQPTLTRAAREPGVDSGDNPVITDIDLKSRPPH